MERPGGTETILLVDDEEQVRSLIARSLRRLGYRVLEAGDSRDALRQAEHHPGRIDLLLTDVVMPGTSGTRLVAEIGAMREEIKVLYMSGYDDTILDDGVGDNVLAFVQKPVSAEMLARKVREVLDTGR